MIIKILTEGGAMKPGPTLSQKLGPAGVNMGQVISKVNDATKQFTGMKVPVELDINITTKEIKVNVLSPPTSELLKKELSIPTASGDHKKIKVGNLSIEQVIAIAKAKYPNMLAKDLKKAVKMVVGTCVSSGILVESKSPQEIEQEIDQGAYNKEIKEEKTIPSSEKRNQLDDYFSKIKLQQEKALKQAAAEKEAAVAAAAAPATEGAKAKPEEKVPAKEEAKKEVKKSSKK